MNLSLSGVGRNRVRVLWNLEIGSISLAFWHSMEQDREPHRACNTNYVMQYDLQYLYLDVHINTYSVIGSIEDSFEK